MVSGAESPLLAGLVFTSVVIASWSHQSLMLASVLAGRELGVGGESNN